MLHWRFHAVIFLGVFLGGASQLPAQDPQKPITTLPGKAGDLLRKWHKEGTAAGNDGDYYDNRDAVHSDLDTAPFPQLKRIVYSAEEVKARRHWAGQHTILPH